MIKKQFLTYQMISLQFVQNRAVTVDIKHYQARKLNQIQERPSNYKKGGQRRAFRTNLMVIKVMRTLNLI